MQVLVLGYGNPGRGDDGLGPAVARFVAGLGRAGVAAEVDYQLNVEHAAELARFDVVVFADAAAAGPAPFFWREIGAEDPPAASFTTHQLAPADVMALARTLYGCRARGFVLGLRGCAFDEFVEGLSAEAQRHLEQAQDFLVRQLDTDFAAPGPAASGEVIP